MSLGEPRAPVLSAGRNAARWAAIASAAVLVAASPERSRAGGPLLVEGGIPYRWSTAGAVNLNLDQGPLGPLTNEEASLLVANAAGEWDAVSTSTLRLAMGAQLSGDVEGLSVSEFWAFVQRADGTNPVIFDSQGEITDNLFGPGSGVLGAAGPSLVFTASRTIIKGFVLLNGREVSPSRMDSVRAVLTHEIGHLLNLGHSQLNGVHVGESIPGFAGVVTPADVETMYPILVSSAASPHPMSTLHQDDVAAFSALYPAHSFTTTTAAALGTVLDADGVTPLQGVNVVARNGADPFGDAVSYVSGLLAGSPPSPVDPTLDGLFELRGLAPGASYKIYVEEVASNFRGASSVGPRDPPLDVDPTADPAFLEFWNADREAGRDPPDDPLDAEPLALSAGEIRRGVSIVLNSFAPAVDSVEPNSSSYLDSVLVTVQGSNLLGTTKVWLSGTIPWTLEDILVQDSRTVLGTVPAGALPGTYQVFVETDRGESPSPGPPYLVTEPPPIVTSVTPDAVENVAAAPLAVSGEHFLGTRAAWIRSPGLADVDLRVGILDSTSIAAEVPRGAYPGEYRVVVRNTAGDSAPSESTVRVVERLPVLAGIDPSAAPSSSSVVVKIAGENLAGTRRVELVRGGERIELVIRSTSLAEVSAVVPAGLETGAYLVSLTNTVSTVEGPASFRVRAPRSGGGGCSAAAEGGRRTPAEVLPWIAALAAIRLLAGGRRERAASPERHAP